MTRGRFTAMKKYFITLVLLGVLAAQNLFAWSSEGHRLIGQAAFELLDDSARAAVLELLGNPRDKSIAKEIDFACNWPDRIREQSRWTWTAPLHYVNIPRHTDEYDRERDCPDGRCVTEGILDFADQLTYDELDKKKRWQAFSFVCHLVGDLHQPLHAGFRDDLGANTVDVVFRGEKWNLHEFWDGVLVRERLVDENRLVENLVAAGRETAALDWHAPDVRRWTEESHALAKNSAYPDAEAIDDAFADRSWIIIQERWERAAGRLAQVLNAVLGENEVSF